MTLTEAEQRFLSAQRHGRLATIAPDGTPQVKPVGFRYNEQTGTDGHLAPQLIRIHPRRVLAFNVDPDHPGLRARDAGGDATYSERWPR
jgi:hypothetical protein